MKFKELEPHWLHECKEVDFTCNDCAFVAKREAIQEHFVCLEIYEKKIAEDEELIATLVDQN